MCVCAGKSRTLWYYSPVIGWHDGQRSYLEPVWWGSAATASKVHFTLRKSIYQPCQSLEAGWKQTSCSSVFADLFVLVFVWFGKMRQNFVTVFAPIRWAPVWWSSASFGVIQTCCLRVDASIRPGQNFGSGPPASVHQNRIFGNPEEQQRMWKQSSKL